MNPTDTQPARTLIIQSFRTHDVAPWQARCMQSVREWALASGYEYEFVDDRLFEFAPAWYRERCGTQRLPVTDLARLMLLRQALHERGYDRAAWLDADFLVFDPAGFTIAGIDSYAFAREIWLARDISGGLVEAVGVNNSVVVMCRGNPVLDFYIHACQAVVARCDPSMLQHNAVGTVLLSAIARGMPMPVVDGVGLISPAIVLELAGATGQGNELTRLLARRSGPLAALNLCGSLIGVPVHGIVGSEADMEAAVKVLLGSRGEVINRLR